jgi:hypothetical protein
MDLNTFIRDYDREGMVVLLEGKRDVLPEDAEKLVMLGHRLAAGTRHILFRSGNASGSDAFFAQGVVSVDPNRFQVVVPYDRHRTSSNQAGQTVSLDGIDLASEPEVVYESRQHRKTAALVDKYVAGQRDRFAIKAAYILRDTVKVLGAAGISPAGFAIFYDDLSNPEQGGTGHTMQVCKRNHVPMIDQRVWFDWVR